MKVTVRVLGQCGQTRDAQSLEVDPSSTHPSPASSTIPLTVPSLQQPATLWLWLFWQLSSLLLPLFKKKTKKKIKKNRGRHAQSWHLSWSWTVKTLYSSETSSSRCLDKRSITAIDATRMHETRYMRKDVRNTCNNKCIYHAFPHGNPPSSPQCLFLFTSSV